MDGCRVRAFDECVDGRWCHRNVNIRRRGIIQESVRYPDEVGGHPILVSLIVFSIRIVMEVIIVREGTGYLQLFARFFGVTGRAKPVMHKELSEYQNFREQKR